MQRLLPALLVASLLVLAAPTAFAQCVTGTISSELMVDGPFAGLWKYTVNLSWDVQQGLSNVALFCETGCSDVCAQTVAFEDTSGTGDGVINDETSEPGDCVVPFTGEFVCNGSPKLPNPHIKFDALDNPECEPGTTGTATLCFYTELPPSVGESPVILIKNGQNVCEGTLQGDCPQCPVAVEKANWTKVKKAYRDE